MTHRQTMDMVIQAVQRRAMEIVDLPEDQREGHYLLIREAYSDGARELGATDATAMGEKMVEFTRALVKIMEAGGGASGGRA